MSGSCGWFPLGRDEIRAWVELHRDRLPQTLAELSAFPIPFRREIILAISPERRIALWREHLATFLAPHVGLRTDQLTLVRDVIADLPAIFGVPLETGQARALLFEDRMHQLMTGEQAYAMFGTIGPPEPPEGLPLPPDVSLPSSQP